MSVLQLYHYAINAPAEVLDALVEFYDQLLGLKVGFRPDFGFNGYWLYAGDHPVLHLLEDSNRQPGGSGYLDHIALRCDAYAQTVAKLDALGVHYDQFDNVEMGQTQLFIKDPAGTTVELNFIIDTPEGT